MYTLMVAWDSDGPVGGMNNMRFSARASHREMQYNYLADRDYSWWPLDSIGTASAGPASR